MTDFCWTILLADEIGQLYHSSDISLTHTPLSYWRYLQLLFNWPNFQLRLSAAP